MAEVSYKNIKDRILAESSTSNQPVEVSDTRLLTSIRNESRESDPEYEVRNKLYTDLLHLYIKSYKSKTRWKKWFKVIFFSVTLLILCGIVIISLLCIYKISSKKYTAIADIVVIIGGFSGILSSILIIPKIIAEHLFPNDEDANMIGMVKNMQLNDTGIRNWLSKDGKNRKA